MCHRYKDSTLYKTTYKPISMTPSKVGQYNLSQRDLPAGVTTANPIVISLSSQHSPLPLCKSFFWWCCIVLDLLCPKSEVCTSWSLYPLYVFWSQHLYTHKKKWIRGSEGRITLFCFIWLSFSCCYDLLPSPHCANIQDFFMHCSSFCK